MGAALRRTKIVATLGPATDAPGLLERLAESGMDCARLNCSHSGPDDLRRRAEAVRRTEEAAGRPLALLFDLQGPKIRLGSGFRERRVESGERVTLVAGEEPITEEIPVAYEGLVDLLGPDSEIVIGDGAPRLRVTGSEGPRVRTTAETPGLLAPRKGVNVTFARPTAMGLSEKDEADLEVACECGADFIALSFVRSADDVHALRRRLGEMGSQARVIAKIEKVEAYRAVDEIIAAADGIMVARGDFGVEAGPAAVPLMQKDVIERAGRAGKLAITATHMLESMTSSPVPTRAEATDVVNAVLDRTSAVMLSGETATGSYPVEAVRTMAELVRAAERSEEIYRGWVDEDDLRRNPATAVMHAAVTLGRDVDAEAIIVPTRSGGSVRAAAKYRPRRPIIALAHDRRTARQLALEWGVHAGVADQVPDTQALLERLPHEAQRVLPGLRSGGLAVASAGSSAGLPGGANQVTLMRLP